MKVDVSGNGAQILVKRANGTQDVLYANQFNGGNWWFITAAVPLGEGAVAITLSNGRTGVYDLDSKRWELK